MNRDTVVVWLMAAALVGALAVESSRLTRARREAAAAEESLASLVVDLEELLSLRGAADRAAPGAKPAQDTLARLTGAMAEAGVPGDRLRELARESDEAGAGPYRTLSMRITVEPVTVAELGRVLAAWRGQDLWTPTRIELSHRAGAADESYSAGIVMTAAYVEEGER